MSVLLAGTNPDDTVITANKVDIYCLNINTNKTKAIFFIPIKKPLPLFMKSELGGENNYSIC